MQLLFLGFRVLKVHVLVFVVGKDRRIPLLQAVLEMAGTDPVIGLAWLSV